MVVFGYVSQNGKIAISKRARANLVVSRDEVVSSEASPNPPRNAVRLDCRFGGRLGPAIHDARIVDDLFPDLAVSDLSRGPGIYG
jgi:hypothetical protein